MNIKRLIFPQICIFCNQLSSFICDKCRRKNLKLKSLCPACLQINTASPGKFCSYNCQLKFSPLNKVYFFEFFKENFLSKVIKSAKYKLKRDLTTHLSFLLYIFIDNNKFFNSYLTDWIWITIPSSKSNSSKRGFELMKLTIKKLKKKRDEINFTSNVLKINKTKINQVTLNKNERFNQAKNKFFLRNKDLIASKNVLLIDDISTTGASLIESAKLLKTNGVKEIHALVLCRKTLSKNKKNG